MTTEGQQEGQEPHQVYVVTHGCYSDYSITAVWLTLEEAQADVEGSDDHDGYGRRIEVWPIGEHKRTLGTFYRSADFNARTGEVFQPETADDYARLPQTERAEIITWANRDVIGIRVEAETEERADKVYSEVKAKVLADISTGLPKEVIASSVYENGAWRPIKR